jgi:hypothetical protein
VRQPTPGPNYLSVLDFDSGLTKPFSLPPGSDPNDFNFQFVRRGARLVVLGAVDTGAGHGAVPVYSYPADLTGTSFLLGQATVVLASTNPGRVWLTADLRTSIGQAAVHLDEVDLKGLHTSSVDLRAPTDNTVAMVAPVTEGFVVTSETASGAARTDVYDQTGRAISQLGAGTLVGAQASQVVWQSGDQLWLSDLATGTRHLVSTGSVYYDGVFSPDAARVAMIATGRPGYPSSLAILDIASAHLSVGPATWVIPPAWSTTGRDVFFVDPDTVSVDVWQVAEEHLTKVALSVGSIDQVEPL